MATTQPFRIRLLGTFALERDGHEVQRFHANRPELLLMYMAVAPDTWHLRKSIAADLWPATDVSTARKHLSYNLFLLKKITAGHGLETPFEETRHALRLRPDLGLDTRDFLHALAAAGAAQTVDGRLRHLEAALELYGQGLLPSHRQPWLTVPQQRLAELADGARQMMTVALPAPAAAIAGQLPGLAGAWAPGGPIGLASDGGPAPAFPGLVDGPAEAPPHDGDEAGWTLGAWAAWADEAEAAVHGPDRDAWLAQFDDRAAALADAVEHAIRRGRALEALPICAALSDYYRLRRRLPEGRRLLDRLLAEVRAVPPQLHARALHSAGTMAYFDGDRETARRRLEQALARWRALKEPGVGLLRTLGNLAIALQGLHELDRAAEIYDQCLAMAQRLDEPRLAATALYNAAQNEIRRRDPARARALIAQRQALLAERPDVVELARTYALEAAVDILLGAPDDARHAAALALSLYTSAGDGDGTAHALRLLGQIALADGDADGAEAHYDESLAVAERSRSFWDVGQSLAGLALVYRERGDEAKAQATYLRASGLLRAAQDDESVRRLAAEFAARAPATAPAVAG